MMIEFSLLNMEVMVNGLSRSAIWSSTDEEFAPNEWNFAQALITANPTSTIELIFRGDCAPGDAVSLRNPALSNIQNDAMAATAELIKATGGLVVIKISQLASLVDVIFYRVYARKMNGSESPELVYAGICLHCYEDD